MSNIVAIVGRPNVGKSTFFNRLIERRTAIVDDISGVTRDRIYGHCFWNGKTFSVVDTGGFVDNSKDIFEKEIAKQVLISIQESDAIIFMVDVETGITDLDVSVADILRKSKKPVFIAVNKVDNSDRIKNSYEFYNLGLGEIYCISSINGSGTGDLLDEVVASFTDKPDSEDLESMLPKFTIVGRPNVGKSSLTNVLVGEERNIVTDIPGTTRDSITIRYNKYGQDFLLIDTAGLRKKTKVNEDLEFYSVMRAIRAIELSDVCFLMLDASQGMEAQDLNILSLVQKNKKAVVVLVNKWDLIEDKKTNTIKEYIEKIKNKTSPFTDYPIIFISAKEKQRIHNVLKMGMEVYENRKQKISTAKLNKFLLDAIAKYPPPSVKGKYIKIKYVTQLPTKTPKFVFFANLPQYIKDAYVRYLENKIREEFDFTGTTIDIIFRKK